MKQIELNPSLVATVASQNEHTSCNPEEHEDTVQDGRVFKTQGEVDFVMTTALILIAGRCPPLNNIKRITLNCALRLQNKSPRTRN